MQVSQQNPSSPSKPEPNPETFTALRFRGGMVGALAPFFLYLVGVAWLAFSGAPDERGFWPIVLAAMILGLVLATNRTAYCEVLIKGMSQPIVSIMIMAWLLAGVLGALMNASGFVEALGLDGSSDRFIRGRVRRSELYHQLYRFHVHRNQFRNDLSLWSSPLSGRRAR